MGNLAGASDDPMGWSSKYNPESMDEMGTQDGNVKKNGRIEMFIWLWSGYGLSMTLVTFTDNQMPHAVDCEHFAVFETQYPPRIGLQ